MGTAEQQRYKGHSTILPARHRTCSPFTAEPLPLPGAAIRFLGKGSAFPSLLPPGKAGGGEYGNHSHLTTTTTHLHADLTIQTSSGLSILLDWSSQPPGLVLQPCLGQALRRTRGSNQQPQVLARQGLGLLDESFSSHNQSLPSTLLFPTQPTLIVSPSAFS